MRRAPHRKHAQALGPKRFVAAMIGRPPRDDRRDAGRRDANPAVRRGDIVDQLHACLSAGDVDCACLGQQAAIPQASGDGFCEPFVDVTDDDVGAFRREAITDRRTDTTTAPGDNRNGVPESFHYFPLLFLPRGMR
jgi:hypothetical protein